MDSREALARARDGVSDGMLPARWERIKELVADALERAPKERAEFIARACGDDTGLQGEVQSIVGQSVDAFDRCASRMAAPDGDRLIGTRLGAYEICKEIGRGGMGAVYLARRADREFEKEVAIKVLKRGTDTDEVLRRFRSERQILARLEHPNIARLIDAGTTTDGLPYFAMEYIQGVPITEFCAERTLSDARRIELMLQVCGAVQFAHQNLVVHRDLKPRNILVTAEGVPKLLDFGIAKLLSDDSDALQVTVQGGQRLTPGYASPEQVRGEAVTTPSDVYSLGALLYELLSGQTPHRFSTSNPSPTELQRVIVEVEPPRLTSAPTDLETIARKALNKQAQRRYSTVAAFADDLRRHLEGRPVRARPATLRYRASRFVARNKLAVTAGVLLFITLLAGIAATLWQARVAQQQAALAQRRFHDVRKLARAVMLEYDDLVASLRGATPVRQRLVNDGLAYLETLSREAANDHTLLREIATAYDKIGRIQGNSFFSNLGDTAGALKSYRAALELRQRLLTAQPNDRELIHELASTHTGLGDVLYETEDLTGALSSYEQAVKLYEPLCAAAPDNLVYRLQLVEAYSRVADLKGFEHYSNLGDPAGGLAAGRRAQELLENVPADARENRDVISKLANVLLHVGVLSCSVGDAASAIAAQRKAVALLEGLAAREPDSQPIALELSATRHFLRFSLEDNGQLSEAIELSRQIVADVEQLVRNDPQNALFRRNLALSYSVLGKQLLLAGDTKDAEAHQSRAFAMLDESLAGDPNSTGKKKDVALALSRLGDAQHASGDPAAAVESFRRALVLLEPVRAADPTNARVSDDFATASAGLGKALAAQQDFAGAREAFARAVAVAEETADRAPTNARLRAHLAERYADAAAFHRHVAETDASCSHLSRSAEIWRQLRERGALLPVAAPIADRVAQEVDGCSGSGPRPFSS
jgi:tetratricopeptide (TPR) repeat protein/predicted Ser/Thr protein kinase